MTRNSINNYRFLCTLVVAATMASLGGCKKTSTIADVMDGGLDDGAIASDGGVTHDAGDGAVVRDANNDASDATVCASNELVVPNVASTQSVTFHVTGASGYVITTGINCTPYAIRPMAHDPGPNLHLALTQAAQIVCEGAQQLAIGEGSEISSTATDIVWDARAIAGTYHIQVDCATHGWPGLGCEPQLYAGSSPVAAGHYAATFGIYNSVPSMMGFPGERFGDFADACTADRTVTVEFDLPASGNVDVDVVVPPPV